MRLKSVVLPAPFGPMMRRRSPGSTARSTEAVTSSPPKDLSRPRTASAVEAAHRAGPSPGAATAAAGGATVRAVARRHRRADAGHQPVRHEDDDRHEDGAEDEVPALDVGARHVLHDDDEPGAHHRAEQRPAAARDHHQERLGRGGERHRLRAHELVVVEEEQPGHPAPEAREEEGEEPDHPDVVAEGGHAPGLVARPAQGGPERRGDQHRHRPEGEHEHHEGRPVEVGRRGERQPERARPPAHRDAVVAVRDADPAIGDTPDDLAERQGDHHEPDAGAAQREHREQRGGRPARGPARPRWPRGGHARRSGCGPRRRPRCRGARRAPG